LSGSTSLFNNRGDKWFEAKSEVERKYFVISLKCGKPIIFQFLCGSISFKMDATNGKLKLKGNIVNISLM
jgi:hypothetical protein